mgnify:CR=1 FL=1
MANNHNGAVGSLAPDIRRKPASAHTVAGSTGETEGAAGALINEK